MKTSHWALVLLLIAVVVGFSLWGGVTDRRVLAQGVAAQPISPQRFQISAWGVAGVQGCYIVDTVTGELWRAAADGQPRKISEKLR